MTRSFRPSSWASAASSDRPRRPAPLLLALLAATAAVAGCGAPRGVLFEPPETPLRWPAPPETPRIEYVGSLETSDDLRPAKTFGEVVGEGLFGRRPARSMLSPRSVCADAAGRLFVADADAQTVHVFDLENRRYGRWEPPDPGFAQPVALALDGQGRLLVSDSVGGAIHVFAPGGEHLGLFGAGALRRPCGIVVDAPAERILVVDSGAHEIVAFDRAGRLLRRVGGRGAGPGRFNYPTYAALGAEGRLYVADSLNFRVQVLDAALNPLGQIGSEGDLPGYFSQPKGVALDGDGHVYVVDAHFEAVQIFDLDGRLLLTFGHEGTGPGEFWLPVGIHIDRDDRIWVADSYNRRVQVFQYLAVGQEAG